QQSLVEAAVRVAPAPAGPGLVPQGDDLELAPGVAAVGRVVRGAGGLGPGRGAAQEGVGLEAMHGLLHVHGPGVQPGGPAPAAEAYEGLHEDPDGEARILLAAALLHAQ